ncbi:MAG: tetratricopeptide repeat protein, partial [Bacteroidetes bacterium]|nr:tetratricopeptide repeat protein [Bacteroidota bacterium]
LGNIGLIYSNKGELDEALKYHKSALELDRQIGYVQGEASGLGNIGLIYRSKGELDEALKYLKLALIIWEKLELGGEVKKTQEILDEVILELESSPND